MKRKTVFECDFCRKRLVKEKAMKKHEAKCFQNPETKSCCTCNNLSDNPLEQIQCYAFIDLSNGLTTNCPKWTLSARLQDQYGNLDNSVNF